MNYFFKLNIVSIFIAFMYFLSGELSLNYYRIWRLTNYNDTITKFIYPIKFLLLLLSLVILFFLIKKWLDWRWSNLWIVILWIPYAVVFFRLFILFFPFTYEGDDPGIIYGFTAMFEFIIYQTFLFLTILFSNGFSK